jgi:hypothetical protein
MALWSSVYPCRDDQPTLAGGAEVDFTAFLPVRTLHRLSEKEGRLMSSGWPDFDLV